ncbi:MATE family efflux transporter [Oribacterium sp. HCP28S3_H8]|uniref:MATE family efflux transporter n=1 Tax=Oribacterium sp. HCP28S3_H8 TaxID=3438945 RepID=UPI003F8A736F
MLGSIRRLEAKVYDRSQVDFNHLLFTGPDLRKLLIPLIIENMLTAFMGMADSLMVTRVGSAAISAVSLTDSINNLVIELLQALAAGGTIICSQYIGAGNRKRSNQAARQVVLAVLVISIGIMLSCLIFRGPILRVIFGSVEPAVMTAALTYFFFTALSFPAIGLFQVGAAFYRAGGNSRFPMTVSVISNVMNIIGNSIFIFVFHWGVMGAALSTLLSRIFAAVVLMGYLRLPRQDIVIRDYKSMRPDFSMIARILSIGIPAGIENSMFQFGKLAIQSSVSTLGTTAIAAQAMTIIFENLNGIGAAAVGIGLMTVAGQTLGAGKLEEAKYYFLKLMWIGEMVILISCAAVYVIAEPAMVLSGLVPEARVMSMQMLTFISLVKLVIWVPAFIIPYGLKAAGDVRFTMISSSLSMWLLRVVAATVLIRVFGFGPIAVWIGMALDWLVRAVLYTWRFLSGKWIHQLI